MNLSDIQFIFNRAFTLTFNQKKLAITFGILALCGVLVVFFRGISMHANHWVGLSMTFLPIFLCAGILLSVGIILVRAYHDEIKKKEANYKSILANSWEVIIGASYFAIPIILSYLLLWMLLGVFVLLRETPGIGEFFAVILSFGPFILNFGSIVLCALSLLMLFVLTPIVALKGTNRIRVSQTVAARIKGDVFGNFFLCLIAILPLLLFIGALILAGFLTGTICYACEGSTESILQWFFMMIPFTALLAPSVIFFFNFAAESHVLVMKTVEQSSRS